MTRDARDLHVLAMHDADVPLAPQERAETPSAQDLERGLINAFVHIVPADAAGTRWKGESSCGMRTMFNVRDLDPTCPDCLERERRSRDARERGRANAREKREGPREGPQEQESQEP